MIYPHFDSLTSPSGLSQTHGEPASWFLLLKGLCWLPFSKRPSACTGGVRRTGPGAAPSGVYCEASLTTVTAFRRPLWGPMGGVCFRLPYQEQPGFSEQSFCLCPMDPVTRVTDQGFLIHPPLENPAPGLPARP